MLAGGFGSDSSLMNHDLQGELAQIVDALTNDEELPPARGS